MGTTVASFMEFARTPELAPQNIDLGALGLASSVGLRPEPTVKGGARAWADPKAVSLVLGVLLSNAAEAAGPEGQVELRLSQMPDQAVLHVWDSGAPLDNAQLDSLFTPFFTTKAKGLGLGLATAASLADHMGGSLSLLSDAKTFQLTLPFA